MRTTLTIDDDLLAVVRELAERQRRSLGAVISDLARQSLVASEPQFRNGVPLLPKRPGARPAASAAVRKLLNDLT
jgi:hypothetical protein